LANTGFKDAQYQLLLEQLITDGLLLYAWPVINGSVHTNRSLNLTLGPTVRGAHELWPSIMQ